MRVYSCVRVLTEAGGITCENACLRGKVKAKGKVFIAFTNFWGGGGGRGGEGGGGEGGRMEGCCVPRRWNNDTFSWKQQWPVCDLKLKGQVDHAK